MWVPWWGINQASTLAGDAGEEANQLGKKKVKNPACGNGIKE